MAVDLAALANKAAKEKDMTVESTGFVKELPVAGKALCRLREYIELGSHASKSTKFPKPPAPKARFIFELTLPKHQQVFKKDGEEDRTVSHEIRIDVNLGSSPRGNFMKLFKQLNFLQDVQHPAQLLGRGFLCNVIHSGGNDQPISDKNPAKYANLHTGGSEGHYTFEAPRHEDPVEGTVTDIPVPELSGGSNSLKLFLWDDPTKECWDMIHKSGTYTKKVEGKPDEELSLNFTQNLILEATNFEGSPLDLMLSGAGELDTLGELGEGTQADEAGTPTDPLEGMGL